MGLSHHIFSTEPEMHPLPATALVMPLSAPEVLLEEHVRVHVMPLLASPAALVLEHRLPPVVLLP